MSTRQLIVGIVAIVIVLGFGLYLTTYTVAFNQVAVKTSLGKVEGASEDEGLHFKWPAPFNSVTLYDTRARFLQTESETQQTADDRQIILESFLTWRISDPVTFYQRFRSGSSVREHYAQAEGQLRSLLRSAMSEVSNYRLGELFAAGVGQSKLSDLEADILDRLRETSAGGGNVDTLGIEITLVGINSVELPEDTTQQVFQRMTESRRRLAAQAESEGEAVATAIRSGAENDAERIRNFAQLRAEQIKARGDIEATQYLQVLNTDPDLANFLAYIDFLREGLGKNVTMVLPTSLPGLGLLSPEAADQIRRGELPSDGFPAGTAAPAADVDLEESSAPRTDASGRPSP